MKSLLEIACFNIESCLIAQNAGAHRIEFCSDRLTGGVTPSREEIIKARTLIKIPLFVMIRPRGGDFVFTNEEKEKMKADVLFCKDQKIDGIVFGALTVEDHIDEVFCKEIIAMAYPLPVTFHRAIDHCLDLQKAFETLIQLRIDRVLTSGGQATALEGISILKTLQTTFGSKITIMPGGGIRSNNISQLIKKTGCKEFHSAAIIANSSLINSEEIEKMKVICINADNS